MARRRFLAQLAALPFVGALSVADAQAGHQVQIFLLGGAVSLMRPSVAKAVVPSRWSSGPIAS